MSQNKRSALKLKAEDGINGPKPHGVCLRVQKGGDSGKDMGVGLSMGSWAQSG